MPMAAVIAPHPRRSINAPAATGPNSVAAAMAQLKRAKACAYAPPGPKASGSSFSFSSTTVERSAATGETMRMSVKPAVRGMFSYRLDFNIDVRRLEAEGKRVMESCKIAGEMWVGSSTQVHKLQDV